MKGENRMVISNEQVTEIITKWVNETIELDGARIKSVETNKYDGIVITICEAGIDE